MAKYLKTLVNACELPDQYLEILKWVSGLRDMNYPIPIQAFNYLSNKTHRTP